MSLFVAEEFEATPCSSARMRNAGPTLEDTYRERKVGKTSFAGTDNYRDYDETGRKMQ